MIILVEIEDLVVSISYYTVNTASFIFIVEVEDLNNYIQFCSQLTQL